MAAALSRAISVGPPHEPSPASRAEVSVRLRGLVVAAVVEALLAVSLVQRRVVVEHLDEGVDPRHALLEREPVGDPDDALSCRSGLRDAGLTGTDGNGCPLVEAVLPKQGRIGRNDL